MEEKLNKLIIEVHKLIEVLILSNTDPEQIGDAAQGTFDRHDINKLGKLEHSVFDLIDKEE